MLALSRCSGLLALFLAGAEGARISRRSASASETKFIGGVPVYEYQLVSGDLEAEEEWVLMLAPETTDARVQSLCLVSKNGCNLVGHPTGGVPFLQLRGNEADLEKVIRSDQAAVKFVMPDQEDEVIPEIDEGDVDIRAATWGLDRIGADARSKTGAGVTIYIQDTGVRVTHQEFGGRASSALDVTSGKEVECKGDLNCAVDGHGHGTHCAGSAAGATFGVAPGASIAALKSMKDNGTGSRSHQFAALDWVAFKGTRPAVTSLSIGAPGRDRLYAASVDSAVTNGVTVVVAAGNSNRDACNFSPAFAPNAITVGSTTSLDERSGFSNFGSCVKIWAPGSDILSAGHKSDSGTLKASGTSMACPHVSGAAALLLEDDEISPAQVREKLSQTSMKGFITQLKAGDTNELLWVGGEPVPTPPPTGCSRVEGASGPNFVRDCTCAPGLSCYQGGNKKCDCRGLFKCERDFKQKCTNCECRAS